MIYDYVISIGDFCFWAHYLKECQWRSAAFPFDWMFTNLQFVIDCVNEDFQPILEYIKNKNQHGQRHYPGQPFDRPNTPHHFMESLEDHQHYFHCIDRWNQIMLSNKKILFLHISGDFIKYEEILSCKFKETMCNKYPNLNFGLLCLKYTVNSQQSFPVTLIFSEDQIIYWAEIIASERPTLASWISLNRHVEAINSLFNNEASKLIVNPSKYSYKYD
jgi:hypothetical protein